MGAVQRGAMKRLRRLLRATPTPLKHEVREGMEQLRKFKAKRQAPAPDDIEHAMSPLARITRRMPGFFERGQIVEIIDGDEDFYAVADGGMNVSMCGVWCVPINAAAVDLWIMAGWKVPS